MKRRKAIQNITAVSAGVFFLSSCELLDKGPVYSNLLLERDQKRLISEFSDSILPKEGIEITTPESTLNFILRMINDCYAPEDIEKYVAGLNEFQIYLEQNYSRRFVKIETPSKMNIFEYLETSEETSEVLKYFYITTRRLTMQHFTSSDFFMTNYLEYEMVPGRFFGCVPV